MVPEWPALLRQARHAESFGIHTEEAPAEWEGQELELVPAVYATPRPDTVTLCVGVAGHDPSQGPPTEEIPGAEFDFLELLYAKDQEGKMIQVLPFPSYGFQPVTFRTFSFVPPKGTTSITPFACFKIRGVWTGPSIEWDPEIGSDEMKWFTDMSPELRAELLIETSCGLHQRLPLQRCAIPSPRRPFLCCGPRTHGKAMLPRHELGTAGSDESSAHVSSFL